MTDCWPITVWRLSWPLLSDWESVARTNDSVYEYAESVGKRQMFCSRSFKGCVCSGSTIDQLPLSRLWSTAGNLSLENKTDGIFQDASDNYWLSNDNDLAFNYLSAFVNNDQWVEMEILAQISAGYTGNSEKLASAEGDQVSHFIYSIFILYPTAEGKQTPH